MKTAESLPLDGCTSTPLAGYLKALGTLRLISSDANQVSGSAADPAARGWWDDDRFVLRTSLSRDELLDFFLFDYAPSPLIAPWNGGSGFYAKDNKDGFDPLSSPSVATRFQPMSAAIRSGCRVIEGLGATRRPKDTAKVSLVSTLRGEASDKVVSWIDAALALSGQSLAYPQLLGTGANDGRLDFTNNFMRRLVSQRAPRGLFDSSSGAPSDDAARLLTQALFGTLSPGLDAAAIGQFAPGSAGGPNADTGYEGGPNVNAWDYVLMLEGCVSFAGSASRRFEGAARSGTSFPFTVRMVGAGYGGVEASDEPNARAEFWAPLWSRPTRCCEVEALLTEGRAVLNGRSVRDGLEFARSVTNLGASRGFTGFERYGFLMRAGKSFLATPIGRRSTVASSASSLVEDLDRDGWLERLRRTGRAGDGPTAARVSIKKFEDAVFELLKSSPSPRTVQRTLVALGTVSRWLAVSAKGREGIRTPPPPMSSQWLRHADDQSPEFRVAAALAGLGLEAAERAQPENSETPERAGRNIESPEYMPMASHFGPVSESGFMQRRTWSKDGAQRNAVWGTASLVGNLVNVLDRRLVEAKIRALDDKPLGGAAPARLEDVVGFLTGPFDDAKCAALLAGLIWVRPASLRSPKAQGPSVIPFTLAALKPIFTPDELLRNIGVLERERLPIPPGIVSRLRTGRGVEEAVRIALSRARGSGIASPFERMGGRRQRSGHFTVPAAARRLAAALLIPLDHLALRKLIGRAYTGATPDQDANTAENHNHVS